jgi:hypothetical protein
MRSKSSGLYKVGMQSNKDWFSLICISRRNSAYFQMSIVADWRIRRGLSMHVRPIRTDHAVPLEDDRRGGLTSFPAKCTTDQPTSFTHVQIRWSGF